MDNEVLVKVKTAGLNPLDNMITRGEVKLIVDYKMPLSMGNEFAGVVENTGSNVKSFKKGDKVYGRLPLDKIGAFAEYLVVDEDAIAKIPEYLTFVEASAVPLTALTAMQALEILNPEKGDSIFISGGTGSFGAMAIPIAKSKGLYVITNGNGKNKEQVLNLGADEFIDYKTEDYVNVLSDVDCVIDTLGGDELEKEFKILKNGGKLVSLKGMPNKRFAELNNMSFIKKVLFNFAGRKFDKLADKKNQEYHFIFVHSDGKQLEEVSKILSDMELHPLIDSVFKLDEINKGLEKIDSGGSKGKTIIEIDNTN